MRNKTRVIVGYNPPKTQLRTHKIIGLFAYIYYNSNDGKKKYSKEESSEEFFEYVPIKLLH
jgi:hypothetical protein